jgi:hypothetical protein
MDHEFKPSECPPTFRLHADFPQGVLPEVFGIITVADPREFSRESGLPGLILGDALQIKGWPHYPAEVVLPSSNEPRVSFAVVENLAKLERLARDFIRPGIFWVHRGEVIQTFFRQQPPRPLGRWDRFSGQPPAKLHATGNLALMNAAATAFLCPTPCPENKIREACDWARRQYDEGGTVISGFHTPVEKDVLEILANRGANIIWVPARDLPKTLDSVFKIPMDENRHLIVSPFPYGKPSRATKETCLLRDRFVLGWTPRRFIPHITPGSTWAADLKNLN